jgi:hypothetical protein
VSGVRRRALSGRVGAAVVGLAALLAVAAALTIALDGGSRDETGERGASGERARRELAQDQRPRWTVLPPGRPIAPALAAHVRADAAVRAREGSLEGPIGSAACERTARAAEDPRFATFVCLVEPAEPGGDGYRFRGRVELESGRAAWCKENPAGADRVTIPLARDCTG